MVRSRFRPCPAAVAALALLSAAPLRAQFSSHDATNLRTSPEVKAAFKPAVAAASRATVRVYADGKSVAMGTVVAPDGWVLTKYDQVRDAHKLSCVFKDSREREARLVGVQERNDLALLKVDASGLTPVEWRDSKSAAAGNWVVTPGLSDEPLSIGVVSVATRQMSLRDYPPSPLPTNAGFLGVGLEAGEGGPKINNVMNDSAAARAGVKVDDVVLSVAGKKVEDPDAMINLLRGYKAGESVTLMIRRAGELVELKATLLKRPATFGMNRALFQNGLGREISRRNAGFPVALQHDTVLRAKDCGGPLVDLDGKAVGINIASAGRVDSYAIPSEAVRAVLPDLMAGKMPPPKVEKKPAKKADDSDEE